MLYYHCDMQKRQIIGKDGINMKKTSRILALLVIAALLTAVFAACGQANSPGSAYIVLEESLDAEEYGIGFRNEDIALGLKVQELMDAMISDGKAAEISKKWFGEDILIKDAAFKEADTAFEGDNSLQVIIDKGELVVGLDDSFPPMGFRDDKNEIAGFDIDLANEVAKRLGVKVKVQPIDWDAKEMELSTRRIDCIWNGMTINDDRIASMYFTKAYIANKQVIIVPENSAIKTIADLAGKKVGLQKGSSSYDALGKHAVMDEIGELVQLAENVTVFMDLKAGRIDAFVVDEVAGRYIIANDAGDAK